ncbi:CNH-domain-containing protein [Microstroma glucosiphilum]|uniref:CNH-domain-containing protein n=1 Tax=Pseudomicrostroma glucosiphilum TaxID=1684307 RepID=A0A316UCS7_9BASI|nr:CNH-domain-containing protein [Pseudomicrostroma glucosiphilum]PWN22962.1 CNH-domain-containing protein [Pseudomicrostroma glucosiphilum]
MPAGTNSQTGPPDKRTTAYENIFGRPTAKPKGPVSQPGPSQQQHQLWQQQQQQQQAALYAQQQGQHRWNGGPSHPTYAPYGGGANVGGPGAMGGMYQPSSNNHSYDHPDRRTSVTPSLISRTSTSSAYPSTIQSGTSAADFYAPQEDSTPASAYAHYYSNGSSTRNEAPSVASTSSSGPHYPVRQAPTTGYQSSGQIPRYPQQQAEQMYNNQGPYEPQGGGRQQRSSSSSHATDNSYGRDPRPNVVRAPSVASSVFSSAPGSSFGGSPTIEPPRLPNIDVQEGVGSPGEGNWFKGLSLEGSPARSTRNSLSPQKPGELSLRLPEGGNGAGHHSGEEDTFATPSAKDVPDPFSNEFQTFQHETAQREAALPGQHVNALSSGASSMYDGKSYSSGAGNLRRKESFESDRRSIAASVYTLPGGVGNGSQNNFYQGGGPSAGSSTSNLRYPGGGFTPVNNGGTADMWQRAPRHRTHSSATQAAQAAYSPSMVDGTVTRSDQCSLSFGNGQARPVFAGAPSSHHSSFGSANVPAVPPSHRRGPIVYPALLSRVAEAFKLRVTIAERVKDGLTYKDAFDGREAVARIAFIIKTTDRNLALLLGRALDAQKFFHDVTYDHRLRDSPGELYQFRTRLATPFGAEQAGDHFVDASAQLQIPATAHRENSTKSLPESTASSVRATSPSAGGVMGNEAGEVLDDADDEEALPTGVFTLLTDCYSPTCTRDRLCYSIACPRRLEQQARLNLKPQTVLQRSLSRESLGDVKEPGALWAESVSKEIFDNTSEQERKRQELLNEAIYTERDFVRDLEYLRDSWIKPLRTRDIIPEARRDDFITQVFWNVLEVHAVNSRLAELLTKRQKHSALVDRVGDIFLEMVPHFQPFVKYGAHQLYGKYEFEKEKASNPVFAAFVYETERLPESRKLELNGYLTKPTTRLARYPLLFEAILKATPETNPDKQALPKATKLIKDFLNKVNVETGKSENRFNLAQLDQQLVFKQGEAVDLRLRDDQRELVFKGPLKKRGGTQSESAELQAFLFDHALLMVKAKTVNKNELYKVFRKPIPLELLIVTVYDEVPTGKGSATRPKSIMSKTSTGNRLSGGVPQGSAPKQDAKTGYALTFTYLGRKGYTLTLWASTFVGRRKWFEHIETRQEILRERSNIFDTITLSENFFVGLNKVNCSVPFDFGRRIIYGTEDGVYLSDLREKARPPTKVLPLPGVTQIDVLEEYQILIILAERSVHTFTLDALDPADPMGSLKRGRRISSHTSFFKAGQCLGRTLVCVVKSSSLSSTIKTLEPIEQNVRGKKQPTFRKLLQGGQETLRVFKEFYIPTESHSIHFLKSKLCVGCTKGFEIVDLETLDTQGLLDPADSSLDFVHRKETVKPIAIYRIDGEFLLCYDEFAFYVNKNGWRAKGNWIIHWEGNPSSFAYHHPYVLAFEPSFIEVRHVETGALHQVITGYNLRCLFADVPPPIPRSAADSAAAQAAALAQAQAQAMNPYVRPGLPPGHMPPRPPYPMAGAGSFSGHYPGMPAPPPVPIGYGPQGQVIYRPQPPYPPAIPPQQVSAVVPRPPPRNPVWESVAVSRGQIVFIGDTSVFAVRLANGPGASGASGGVQNALSPALR